MLRLNTKPANWSIELDGNAVLHLRSIQPADVQIARAAAATFLKGVDDEERGPLFRAIMAQTLLQRCLTSWEGIGDAQGEVIEPSRDAVSSLLTIPGVFSKVENALVMPLWLQADEKNASSPSPNGTLPGAQKEVPAPAADQPIAGNA